MNNFHKRFLSEEARRLAPGATRHLCLAAWGKHPGWDDHIEDLGLESDSLVLAKQLIYVEGIGGQVDSGEWEKLEADRQALDFHHIFVWHREGQLLIGRLWSSSDGKGRTRYPMVLCAHVLGLPVRWAIYRVLPVLERIEKACREATSAAEVRSILDRARHELRQTLADAPADKSDLLCTAKERRQTAEQMGFGTDPEGLLRVLYQIDGQMSAFAKGRSGLSRGPESARPQQLRLPALSRAPEQTLLFWLALFESQIEASAPQLLMMPLGLDWLDITLGEPSRQELFCLRASPKALPVVSQIPYELAPAFRDHARKVLDAFSAGATPVPSVFNRPRPAPGRSLAHEPEGKVRRGSRTLARWLSVLTLLAFLVLAAAVVTYHFVGGLRIETIPPGAQITLKRPGARVIQRTAPVRLPWLSPGTHGLEVRFEGFEPKESTLEVHRLEFGRIVRVELEKSRPVVPVQPVTLRVETRPAADRIELSVQTGGTPRPEWVRTNASAVVFSDLAPGEYTLRVEKTSHEPATQSVSLPVGTAATPVVQFELKRARGRLELRSQPAEVIFEWLSVDGDPALARQWMAEARPVEVKRDGQTTVSVYDVVAGKIEVAARLEGWPAQTNTAWVEPGTQVSMPPFIFVPGWIAVRADPVGAEVSVLADDGRQVAGGITDAAGLVRQLAPGPYRVTVNYRDLEGWTGPATVVSGQTNEVLATLEYAKVTVTSDPAGAVVWLESKELGYTPLEGLILRPGTHGFGLTNAGASVLLKTNLAPGVHRLHAVIAAAPRAEFRTNSVGMVLVKLPNRDLWVGQHEVTFADYHAVMGTSGLIRVAEIRSQLQKPGLGWQQWNERMPMVMLTWAEATNFCGQLTAQERGRGQLEAGWAYRLPKEAEWKAYAIGPLTTGSTGRRRLQPEVVEKTARNALDLCGVFDNVRELSLDRPAASQYVLLGGTYDKPSAAVQRVSQTGYVDTGCRVVLSRTP